MILTARLRLRKLNKSTIQDLGKIHFSEKVMKYIIGRSLSTEEAINRYSFNIDDKYFGVYMVERKSDNETVGLAVIRDQIIEAEIGYLVLESDTGLGYGTEINNALITICRKHLKDRLITAIVDSRNSASIRILEKCNMTKQSTTSENGVVFHRYVYSGG